MNTTLLETATLFLPAHRKPELDQMDATAHQIAFELRGLADELLVLCAGTETHDTLNPCPVVPGTIKQHDLPARRQMLDVPLKLPLALLDVSRLFQGNHTCTARIE